MNEFVSCKNCRWFESFGLDDHTDECRRHAPMAANLSATDPDVIDDEGFCAVWPELHEALWCGDFLSK